MENWKHDEFWESVRADFPVLQRHINGKHIVYLDSACFALKPRQVIDAINYYYANLCACAGRSGHALGNETTLLCHSAREKVAGFINARQAEEIVWTRNTTEGINLIANALKFEDDDTVVTTLLEHHSGVLPFHRLYRRGREALGKKINLKIVEPNDEGVFDIESWETAIDDSTKLVSIIHASNLTGTIAPLEQICKIAHDHGAYVIADDAQYAPHHPMDVQKGAKDKSLSGCVDFSAFSVHKMCGPSGMGILYGKSELLYDEKIMDTFMVGGDTIEDVDYVDGMVKPKYFTSKPERYEAGLQNYGGMIGTGATIDYLNSIGMKNIEKREKLLTRHLIEGLLRLPEVEIIGPKDFKNRGALATFKIGKIPAINIGEYVHDNIPGYRIMMRYGAHCVNPFLHHLKINPNPGIEGTIRASLYLYNTVEEIDILVDGLTRYINEK